MLDLKIVEEDQYDLVPVPLPGRLMVFAGASGLMCRRNDGTIANYPDAGAGGGGGGASYITLPLVDGGSDYAEYPEIPPAGFVHLFMTPDGVRMLDQYGNIFGTPIGGGGGDIIEPLQSLRFVELGAYENMPQPGINGEVVFGYVFGELVKRVPSGAVMGLDNTMRWTPPEGGGGAPEE